jgi:hypothetical protein
MPFHHHTIEDGERVWEVKRDAHLHHNALPPIDRSRPKSSGRPLDPELAACHWISFSQQRVTSPEKILQELGHAVDLIVVSAERKTTQLMTKIIEPRRLDWQLAQTCLELPRYSN